VIWAGGRRDPLTAFDEWSKLLFAKVHDERNTATGSPRAFQVGTQETIAAVANRVHGIFGLACRQDRTIFPEGTRINLPDSKVADVVRTLEEVSFTRTDIDSIGKAFEQFFGAVFRGSLDNTSRCVNLPVSASEYSIFPRMIMYSTRRPEVRILARGASTDVA